MNFLVTRPHQRYEMYMAIKIKAGIETGCTFVNGHTDFQVQDDATVKTSFGHYTYESKATVTEPRNVFMAYDVFPRACKGGAGTVPYTHDLLDKYNPERNDYPGDLFFFAVPYEEKVFPNPLDCSGRFLHFTSSGLLDPGNANKLHYSTAALYNGYWGFHQVSEIGTQEIEPTFHPLNFNGALTEESKNTVCWRGHVEYYNPTNKWYDIVTLNTGHWGENTYPGVKEVRNGGLKQLKGTTV